MSIEYMRGDLDRIRNLLFEKISGAIGEADDHFIEHLLATDPAVRAMWMDLCRTMDSRKGNQLLRRLDAGEAWDQVKVRLTTHTGRPISGRTYWRFWAAAAVLLVAMGIHYFYLSKHQATADDFTGLEAQVELRLPSGQTIALEESKGNVIDLGSVELIPAEEGLRYRSKGAAAAEWTTLVVPPTKDYKINLSDGTTVWLNAESTLRFPFNFADSLREVYLEGEGYFTVAKNARRPFVVHAGKTAIHVVGTSFNVNAYDASAVATALVEGSVMATSGTHEVFLEPGYQAFLTSKNNFTTAPFDPDLVLSWMRGSYYFHNQRLSEISEIMERWFNVTVVFKNLDRSNIKFTGTIEKNKPLQVFVTNLELSSDVRATLRGDTLVIE